MSWKTRLLICFPALLAAGLCGSEAPARSPEPFPNLSPFQRGNEDLLDFAESWRTVRRPFFGYYASALGPEFYRFKSPVLGFEVDVPRDWEYLVRKTGETIQSLFAPRVPGAAEVLLPHLSVSYAGHDPGEGIEALADRFVARRREQWPAYSSTRPEAATLDGAAGLTFKGRRPSPDGGLRESVLLVSRGRYAYTAVFSARAEDWAENRDLYRLILFSFLPVGNGPVQQNSLE